MATRVAGGAPVLVAGSAVGLITQSSVAGGIDICSAYNIAAFRINGHGSMIGYLAYGDANGIVLDIAPQVVPPAGATPVLAGVGAADPYRPMDSLLDRLVAAGYSGITNTPTAGVYDGRFRETIEAQGLGYAREIELAAICHARDLFSMMYVFNAEDARQMASAGADAVVAHVGLTGWRGSQAMRDAITRTRQMCDAARETRADVYVLCHGGPLEDPDAVRELFDAVPVDGYVGGSSIERIPVAAAVRESVAAFRELRLATMRNEG
jgi:predicted TIM-barrel enzyme